MHEIFLLSGLSLSNFIAKAEIIQCTGEAVNVEFDSMLLCGLTVTAPAATHTAQNYVATLLGEVNLYMVHMLRMFSAGLQGKT